MEMSKWLAEMRRLRIEFEAVAGKTFHSSWEDFLFCRLCTAERGAQKAVEKPHEFLDDEFLALMNDIGRYGHEKYGADSYHNTGRKRGLSRQSTKELLAHARQHIADYEAGVVHDHFGDLKHQLAAAAFNLLMEVHFSQGE
jgi:hypothetical protein